MSQIFEQTIEFEEWFSYILKYQIIIIKALSPCTPIQAYNHSSSLLIDRILFLLEGNLKVDLRSNGQGQMLYLRKPT